MSETVLGAIIALGGTTVGAVIPAVVQLILNKSHNKNENRRATYQLKIDTYADAIRYIALCCLQHMYEDNDSELYKELAIESDKLYNKFHPIFSIIAPSATIEKYNELRNMADKGEIKASEAYRKVVEILDFNISDDIR